jgi:hypothetical protein
MANTNDQFKQFLNTLDSKEAPVIEVELGLNPPPILSDTTVGQYLHLVTIYVTTVLAYVYTAGHVVGYNFKLLAGATYNMGHTFGTFVHRLNDVVTNYITKNITNHSTTGGAYEHQHNLP